MAAFITRDFDDSGTKQHFTANTVVADMDAGTFLNYLTAGLVRQATDAEIAAAQPEPAPGTDADPL